MALTSDHSARNRTNTRRIDHSHCTTLRRIGLLPGRLEIASHRGVDVKAAGCIAAFERAEPGINLALTTFASVTTQGLRTVVGSSSAKGIGVVIKNGF
ncbi:MAG: hypothetical protein ACTH2Q_18930 [Propionibacteriaceae bacterium]